MFIGAGLNMRNMDVALSYQAALGDTEQQDSFSARQWVPLPTASFGGSYFFTPKWQGLFKYELFLLDLGDYRGSQQEVLVLVEHSTFKHAGFGFGFNLANTNLRANTDEFRGEFDSRFHGLLVYLKFYF